jgi:putative ABC transport system permease protein
MGSGQALLTGPEPAKVFQNADATATAGYGIDGSVQQVPEYAAGQGAASNAKAISAVVGQPVVATQDIQLRFVVGERRVRIESLVIDPRTIDVGAKAHLTGGRWGATADEVVVTPAGQQAGIPTSGRVTISSGGTERNVTVVGTATAWGAFGGQPDLVMPQPPEGLTATDAMYGTPGWIVAGSKPVTWSEVLRLNGYGFTVISRAVLADPPSDSEIPQEVQAPNTFMQDTSQLIAVLGGVTRLRGLRPPSAAHARAGRHQRCRSETAAPHGPRPSPRARRHLGPRWLRAGARGRRGRSAVVG